MIVTMLKDCQENEVKKVVQQLEDAGFKTQIITGTEKTVIAAVGDKSRLMYIALEAMPGVEKVVPILSPFKMASREYKKDNTIVEVGNLKFGGPQIQIIAGPCAIESRQQLMETAKLVKKAGATILRGGAYKPRSSPYSFQGLEEKGLQYLTEVREELGMPIVTEAIDAPSLELVAHYTDIIQIGARNMQNYPLLKKAALTNKPILLKRGLSATIDEWILAAEYIISAGNPQVIMCERGIRTFENYTRNTLDLSAVPVIKHLTHLPITVDPSHGTGKWRLVQPMALAAVAAGADALMIEVHPNPSEALSDGPQSLNPESFQILMDNMAPVVQAVGRRMVV